MILLRVLWFGILFLGCIWLILDVLIPIIQNKPILTMFKKNKKADLREMLKHQNEMFEELDLQEKIHQNQEVIDKRQQNLEPKQETEQEQGTVENVEVDFSIEKEQK